MNTTTILIIIIIYIIFIVFSLFINDYNMKVAYWFIIGLGTLTTINIYLTVIYYIELRNDEGNIGPRGDKGDKGIKGAPGKCTFSKKCNIENCDDIIYTHAKTIFPDVSRKCLENKNNCKSNANKSKYEPVRKRLTQLIKKCKTTTMAEEDFLRKIKPQIELLKQTNDNNSYNQDIIPVDDEEQTHNFYDDDE